MDKFFKPNMIFNVLALTVMIDNMTQQAPTHAKSDNLCLSVSLST